MWARSSSVADVADVQPELLKDLVVVGQLWLGPLLTVARWDSTRGVADFDVDSHFQKAGVAGENALTDFGRICRINMDSILSC